MKTVLRKASDPKPVSPTREPTLEEKLRDRLVELCLKDVGQRETNGNNRSPLIDSINKDIGASLGSPYCISGLLIRGVKVLCKEFGLKNPVLMTASTQTFWHGSPAKFKVLRGNKAKKGDIGILVNKSDSSKGHAFMFREKETSIQKTVEYNTNPAGSRDGDGIYCNDRYASGTISKTYRGAIDVVAAILAANPGVIK